MLTQAQIEWIAAFLSLDPASLAQQAQTDADAGDGTGADHPTQGREVAATGGAGAAEAFDLPSIPSIPDVPDPSIRVHVTINNQSGHQLQLVAGSATLENPNGSEFETPPPDTIDGDKGTATIVVSNNAPYLTGVGGSVSYTLSDEPGTTVQFKWERGRVPKRKATMTLNPDDPKRFEKDFGYDADNFNFTLKAKDKKPDAPGGGVALSCRVTVVNQTQQTVFLRKQDNAGGGDFVTNPATSLAPGASTNFVYAETPNANDHKCRGTLSWDIGDPKQGAWQLMWDNQNGAKNLSSSSVDNAAFHTLDQMDEGDENVPVTFTLSGGGATPSLGPVSCTITVTNQTAVALTQITPLINSGAFQTKPPQKIDPGGSAQFVFTGPADDPSKGASGGVQWSIGDTKTIAWQTAWQKPANGASTVDSKIAPDGSGFSGSAAAKDGNDGTAVMTFVLTGGGQPTPQPDDEFAPPPKSKQPTLRIKDESPDGWVEYAQRLLNKWSNSKGQPKSSVNGNFDEAMKEKVKAFQADQGCQVDGVIGNETWSMLREGPKEKVGTDGRPPHSFEQKGAQGRFVTEKPDVTGYIASDDSYFMWIVSVGEQPIDEFNVEVKVTQPDGTSHTHHFKIGPVVSPSDDGQGNFHQLKIAKFSDVFGLRQNPSKQVVPITCSVDAYLPKQIGGDRWTGPVVAAS